MIFKDVGRTKLIFYTLLVALPINLGLHFVRMDSYVGGLLVDYLIPTLFIQDILVTALIISWLVDKPQLSRNIDGDYLALVTFLFVCLLSVLNSPYPVISVVSFLRIILYFLVFSYIRHEVNARYDYKIITYIFCTTVCFLGVLGVAQFLKQGSIFNNYLFLGEQPYSVATPLIDKENVMGSAVIPSYGLFRHPNIFGGFLVVMLLWIVYMFVDRRFDSLFFYLTLFIGLLGLLTTVSYFSWSAFAVGLTIILLRTSKNNLLGFLSLLFIVFAGAFFIGTIRFPERLSENPSVYMRIELLNAGYKLIQHNNYLFGSGINTFTLFLERFTTPTKYIRFVQPVHNVPVLLAGEVGVLGAILYLTFFVLALTSAYKKNFGVFCSLIAILLMSQFDHYFFTIHQTFLLSFIMLAFAFV